MMRRAGAGAAFAMLAVVLGPVGAANAAGEITIDHVESAAGTASVLLAVDGLPEGVSVDQDSISVTLDGEDVAAHAETVSQGVIERTTILTLDASNSMKGDRFAAAKTAAQAFIAAAPPDVHIGLLTFAGKVKDTVAPTTDHDTVASAIDSITLSPGTSVYDAMLAGMNLAGDEGARSLLVLSDGADVGSDSEVGDVVAQAAEADVIVDVVSLDQSPRNQRALSQVAEESGGKVIEAGSAALAEVFAAQAAALSSQLLVTFDTPAETSDVTVGVSLTADGATYSDSAFVTLDAPPDTPDVVESGDPIVGPGAMLLGALALGVGLALLLAIVLVGSRGGTAAERRLGAYFAQGNNARGQSAGVPGNSPNGLKDSAVALADKVVKGDFETRIAQKLAGAGSALTAAEWLLIHAGIVVAAGFVGFIFRGGALMVMLMALGVAGPWVYLKLRQSRRLAAFSAQLPETLGLMAGGLSAGLSLPQAVDTVVREGHEPMAAELRRALVEQRLGVPIEDALEGVGHRMDSQDFEWVVMAIRIQREVGGNLAELLNTVADTIREREYLRRQVKVLSAEGRISAWVLGALPILMFLYMLMVRPDFVRPLYTQPAGLVLAAVGLVLLGLGFFVMSRLVKIEV